MEQKNTCYQQKGSTRLYLNKSKPLKLTTTTAMNDSVVVEMNISFWFVFIFILYVVVYFFKLYMCIHMNRKKP